MKYRIRNQKDVAAGLFYVLAGAGFSVGALNYKLGEPARMGPGWFPFWIGILLGVVGFITAWRGFAPSAPLEQVKKLELGTIAWIIGAVVLFGMLLKPLGLVGALAALVIVASLASHEFAWRGAVLTAVALIAFSAAVFIWGINLQIPLWPALLH
jgi:hypothetical protein